MRIYLLDRVEPAKAVRSLAEAYEVACTADRDDLRQAVLDDLVDYDYDYAREAWMEASDRPFPLK